jgi:hypothetical protein
MTNIATDSKPPKGQTVNSQEIDLNKIKTPNTNKSVNDFKIPKYMLENDKELVVLVMQSESMNDGERQYWFNLVETMNMQQVEKLRDILTRERTKLAEIEAKYGVKKSVKLTPEEIAKKNIQMEKQWKEKQASLKAREKQAESEENEDDILAELDGL